MRERDRGGNYEKFHGVCMCAFEKRRKWQDMKTESSSLKKMSHGSNITHTTQNKLGVLSGYGCI